MSRQEPLLNHPRYEKVRNLNSGSFGSVQLAKDRWRNEMLVAVKFMERGPTITEYVERELMNHRMLRHPHVISFNEVFLTPYHLGIVLEYAEGGDMFEYVAARKRLGENMARWVFQQLMIAIDYMHRMGVANRDIKLENTLLTGDPDRPMIKLCDLGYAKSVQMHSAPDSRVGTPNYVAPEVLTSPTYDGMVADIWSCGVMLYTMLFGSYPFVDPGDKKLPGGRAQQAMIKRIMRGQFSFPDAVPVSPECKDLLTKMLVVSPAERATMGDLMGHPWFTQFLPAGALTLNADLRPAHTAQSNEEIRKLVREAQQTSTSSGLHPDMASWAKLHTEYSL